MRDMTGARLGWAVAMFTAIGMAGCGSDDAAEVPADSGSADQGADRTGDARDAARTDVVVVPSDARTEANDSSSVGATVHGDAASEAAADSARDVSAAGDSGPTGAVDGGKGDAGEAASPVDGASDVRAEGATDANIADASPSNEGDVRDAGVDTGRDGAVDATPLEASSMADAASDAAEPPATDADAAWGSDAQADAPSEPNCADGPFITNTVTLRDVTSSVLLAGASVKANVCAAVATTNASGVATLQLPRGMESWLRFDASGKIPTMLPARSLVTDQSEARVIFDDNYRQGYFPDYDASKAEILVVVARAGATAPCLTSDGATVAVVGHSEAVVTYWQGGFPNQKAIGATATTVTGVATITGIAAGTQVVLDVQKPGCSVVYDYQGTTSVKVPLETGAVTYVVPVVAN